MKATGIVRRIDDLGRIVIPKDIRRTLGIREGDPLEIYTDREGCVIFKKYAPLGSIVDHAENAYKTLKKRNITCAIYTGDGEKLFGNASAFPAGIDRDELAEMDGRYVSIKADGDVVGYILALEGVTPEQKIAIKTAAELLSTMLEG
jgi:AbrB family looped-hinge helix DNA binding protein